MQIPADTPPTKDGKKERCTQQAGTCQPSWHELPADPSTGHQLKKLDSPLGDDGGCHLSQGWAPGSNHIYG